MQSEEVAYRPFVAVAGNIGVGKSGLTRDLARALEAQPLVEHVDANPFFGRFYENPGTWAFSSQVAFAVDSLRRHTAAQDGRAAVQDRTAFEAYEVFCRVLYDRGHLAEDELQVLAGLRDCAAALPRQPDLLIYLEASIPSLVARIAGRDRLAERHVDAEYLESLQSAYGRFRDGWSGNVLSIDTHRTDLRDPTALARLVAEVKSHR